MNWYLQNGKESDVVVSSRIRLSRNIKGYPFITRASKEELKSIYDKMQEITPSLGYGLKFKDLKDMDLISKEALVEEHIISSEFARSKNPYTAIIINDDESICILINEEDHIKLEAYSSGLELENLMNLEIEIDQKLENIVPYSYHEKYGYLTACPTNVGTGLKASVLVHLPALSLTGNLRKVLNVVNNLGMSIRGVYGEGSKIEGDIYEISNNQTLGVTEKEITKNLNLICQKVMEQERVARKYLTRNSIELEDKIYRDYGILSNARKLEDEETIELLSSVKLGVDLGIIKEINDAKVSKLYLYTKPANLQKRLGKELRINEQDIERANVVKEIINSED